MLFERVNEKICLFFLLMAISFRPLYKYFEYVLDFPRINITAIFLFIFLALILINIYKIDEKFKNAPFYSFLLLLMISFIQVVSFPWAINYTNNGFFVYLYVISKTIIEYWMFWFSGLYIVEIFSYEKFWKVMSWIWGLLVFLIIYNALSNSVFAIILEGSPIYLMLADSFAILSIFVFCCTKRTSIQIIIIIISTICLFALFSRASLYCFLASSLFFLFKKNKVIFLIIFTSLIALLYYNNNNEIAQNRMTRLFFGSFDASLKSKY